MKLDHEVKETSIDNPIEINFLTLDEEETQYVTIHEFKVTTENDEQNYVSVRV